MSSDAKEVVAALAEAWIARGQSAKDFSLFCAEAGYKVPPATISRWLVNLDKHGAALPGGGERGRPRLLSDEQERLFVGYILWRNANNLLVSLEMVRAYIFNSLGVEAEKGTVQGWIVEQGFTSQKMKRKSQGYKLDRTEMTDLAFEWLKKHWRMLQEGEVWCIDCAFLGHRLDVFYSYAVAGGPQPLLKENACRFTNLAIGAISSLGRCHGPYVFTYNQKARRDRNPTKKRDAEVKKLNNELTKNNVCPDQLVYIGNDQDEKRVYVSATADVVQMFLDRCELDKDQLWVSDGGKEFWSKEGSVLVPNGVKHIRFPAAVHQYLSACDNNWFGAAKSKWRSRGLDYSDDVGAAVAFLADLEATRGNATEWMNRNLQLGKADPERNLVSDLIGEKKVIEIEHYRQCLYEYCIAEGKDGRGLLTKDPNDGLDGKYWWKNSIFF
jgi:transposase